jgi:beta-glucosidase
VAPLSAIQEKLAGTGTKIVTSTTDDAAAGAEAARAAETAIVFINSDAGEG